MKRPRFRLWIGSIPFCRYRQDELNATVSSTIATERYRSMLLWKPPQVACTARPQPATPARISWHSSNKSWLTARPSSRFTSFSTISPRTRPAWSVNSFRKTLGFSSTSHPRTLRGSTRWSFGSARSSVTSLLVASSPQSLTWPARSNGTSRLTRPTPSRFTGNTQTPNAAFVVTNSLRQSTRDWKFGRFRFVSLSTFAIGSISLNPSSYGVPMDEANSLPSREVRMKSTVNSPTRRRAVAGIAAAMACVVSTSPTNVFAQQPAMEEKPSTGVNKDRTSLHQEIELKAASQRVFEILLDARQFAALTGMSAEIDPKPGGTFKTFG